jgi:hypothetical protein
MGGVFIANAAAAGLAIAGCSRLALAGHAAIDTQSPATQLGKSAISQSDSNNSEMADL